VNEDFVDLLAALLEKGARFLVIGAYAMAVHGVVRATGDLDLWISTGEDNVGRVWNALEAFGAPLEALGFDLHDLSAAGTVWQIGVAPRRIDILTSIDGVGFDDAWIDRREVVWQGMQVPVLGLAALRRNKAVTGREKDRLDLQLLDDAED
jgi:hypothetical protein